MVPIVLLSAYFPPCLAYTNNNTKKKIIQLEGLCNLFLSRSLLFPDLGSTILEPHLKSRQKSQKKIKIGERWAAASFWEGRVGGIFGEGTWTLRSVTPRAAAILFRVSRSGMGTLWNSASSTVSWVGVIRVHPLLLFLFLPLPFLGGKDTGVVGGDEDCACWTLISLSELYFSRRKSATWSSSSSSTGSSRIPPPAFKQEKAVVVVVVVVSVVVGGFTHVDGNSDDREGRIGCKIWGWWGERGCCGPKAKGGGRADRSRKGLLRRKIWSLVMKEQGCWCGGRTRSSGSLLGNREVGGDLPLELLPCTSISWWCEPEIKYQ